ncbi:hypothetical protein NQZ68_035409 [Dissostichus eleginoides]|nr:hypothetical protein NQZ68_035409 [Dissostichus eleginoides]
MRFMRITRTKVQAPEPERQGTGQSNKDSSSTTPGRAFLTGAIASEEPGTINNTGLCASTWFPGAQTTTQRPHDYPENTYMVVGDTEEDHHPRQCGSKPPPPCFPNATIYIPIINFSDRLNPQQQTLLIAINNTIALKYNLILEINPLLVRVNNDDVHWTTQTAEMLLSRADRLQHASKTSEQNRVSLDLG